MVAGSGGLVVAAAVIEDGQLLLAQRTSPPEFAGLWELPGGKVDLGETPEAALARELREELGVLAEIGARVGVEIGLPKNFRLRAYQASIVSGTATALEHAAIRWVRAGGLRAMTAELVPNDRLWVDDLAEILARPHGRA
jgi:8-oxo-dGTP diphosphatase